MTASEPNTKNKLRKHFIQLRNKISANRRERVAQEATKVLLKALERFQYVCSFASKPLEIDLWPLNQILSQEGRLVLLKTNGQELFSYLVTDIDSQLTRNPSNNIFEPNQKLCELVEPNQIEVVLVPGLAFDKKKHRLGYGQGHYDRFLINLPTKHFYGIGFKEQQTESLPVDSHDFFLTELYLF